MAEASHHRLLQLPRSPNKLECAGSLSSRDHRTLAPDTQPTQSKRLSHLGSNGEAGGRLAPKAANPSSLAQPAFCRQAPEVRAVCIKVHVRIRAGGAGQLASLPRPNVSAGRTISWKATALKLCINSTGNSVNKPVKHARPPPSFMAKSIYERSPITERKL